MVVFVKGGISRDHTQAELHGNEDKFGSFHPNEWICYVRPIGIQKGQDALRPTWAHAATNCQSHQQAVASWHEQH